MKWYKELPLWLLIVFIVMFIINHQNYTQLTQRLFASAFYTILIGGFSYLGYYEVRHKKDKQTKK